MGIVLDVIIVLFILGSIYFGYKKGLISLGIQLVATLVALILTLMIYKPIGNVVMEKTTIDEKIQSVVEENVNNLVDEGVDNAIAHNLVESAKNGVLPQASASIAKNVIYGASILVVFIVLKIAVSLISVLANLVAGLPILKQFNKIGGVIYGLLRGLLITYVILMIVSLVNAINPKSELNTMVDNSKLARIMSNNNVLSLILK